MSRLCAAAVLSLFLATSAFASHGIITVSSDYSVDQTADRLESLLEGKGMTIFNRIDHAAAAARVGQSLRPTVLILFGNPKVGTSLMQCGQTSGIDLPLKFLIWEDRAGKVKLSYNDPGYIADRHGISSCDEVIQKITGAMKNFAAGAAGGK